MSEYCPKPIRHWWTPWRTTMCGRDIIPSWYRTGDTHRSTTCPRHDREGARLARQNWWRTDTERRQARRAWKAKR